MRPILDPSRSIFITGLDARRSLSHNQSGTSRSLRVLSRAMLVWTRKWRSRLMLAMLIRVRLLLRKDLQVRRLSMRSRLMLAMPTRARLLLRKDLQVRRPLMRRISQIAKTTDQLKRKVVARVRIRSLSNLQLQSKVAANRNLQQRSRLCQSRRRVHAARRMSSKVQPCKTGHSMIPILENPPTPAATPGLHVQPGLLF